jgi:hypothetical protein
VVDTQSFKALVVEQGSGQNCDEENGAISAEQQGELCQRVA